ncbi:MAG: mechanosensitive ion channel [Saprospiraceae bacterium]|jgi:small-conductance mechanosensitive channel|nr:mechanosensitive ion channel [Saprospiraceae bacterium]MBP6235179.1 mechanosensitive ion channel [Saprospiraceae bacterium]MBP6566011.1 mechanosensitive ion channel [Saprospiraceae bacterium]
MVVVVVRYILRFLLLAVLLFVRKILDANKVPIDHLYFFLHSIVEFLILLTIVNIVAALLIMVYRLRKNIPYKFTDNVINGINNLYYLIVTFGVIMMILGFWGIDFKSLLTSLSIVAAAIAIISKDYVSGIISGIIISFSKEINIDDYVKIGENKGKILDINLSKTTLLNDDDDIIYLPNEKVYMSEIINYTKKEIKKVSIDFELGIKYHTTIEQLENSLAESLKDFHQYIEPNSFNIKIVDVYHEYLSLKFQYKLTEVNREIERLIRKKTIRLIANSIKDS